MIDTAPAILSRAKDLVDPALADALARLHPGLRRVAEYHFGWIDTEGHQTNRGGKGVRPALTILSAEAVGAPAATGVPGGVALELVHNYSLLHDDVMDGDRERRSRPTVWALYGVPEAILVGDALAELAHQVLLEQPGNSGTAAAHHLADAVAEMIAGQADDMAFESEVEVSVDACLTMAAAKTGALLSCSAAIGAVLAGGEPAAVDALARYGDHVGLAFQAIDDLLGIWGSPAVTGKPVGSDVASRKKTIPISYAMAEGGPSADELRALFGRADLDADDVKRAIEVIESTGGREATEALAREHLAAALEALRGSPLEPTAVAELVELAEFVCDRER